MNIESTADFAGLPNPGAAFYVLELSPALTAAHCAAAPAGAVLLRKFAAHDGAALAAFAELVRLRGTGRVVSRWRRVDFDVFFSTS